MLAIQIQALIIVLAWFAFGALNHSGNPILWAITGGVVFAAVNAASVYLLAGPIATALEGSVAFNGIHFLTGMTGVVLGVACCLIIYRTWMARPRPASA
jgi:hypothetical protein